LAISGNNFFRSAETRKAGILYERPGGQNEKKAHFLIKKELTKLKKVS
jgi:hypothetical protein